MIDLPTLIYLDHAAGTLLVPGVWEAMQPYLKDYWGNPSSSHHFGRRLRGAIERARSQAAAALEVEPAAITFVSSGTEANQRAILQLATAAAVQEKKHIVVSAIEHISVRAIVDQLKKQGFSVSYCPSTAAGHVELACLQAALRPDTGLVSLQHANNETGAVQPVAELGRYLEARDVYLHVDAVQTVGLLSLPYMAPFIVYTLAGHKIGGPAGTGMIIMDPAIPPLSLLQGGKQEHGRRAGTESVAGIVGLAQAIEWICQYRIAHYTHLQKIQHIFWTALQQELHVQRNGEAAQQLPHILNISCHGYAAADLLMRLDLEGVACSAGAACMSGAWQPSPILQAMGLSTERIASAIRFSFSYRTTREEVQEAVRRVCVVCQALRPSLGRTLL